MKGLIPLFVTLFVITGQVSAQNYLMNPTPVNDCDGSFFDSGGGAANYGNNQTISKTFCSNGVGGTHVRLDFGGVDLAAGDELCFYDGVDINATLLSCASDYTPGASITVQATAQNPSGCLTVSFNSDGTGNATGWSSVISCVASCQTVLAEITSTNPIVEPADTGWIDVCPGQRIFFSGQGIYPQNDYAYHQSDFTTSFEWNFGDGSIAYGPGVSHQFNEPGGFYVQMLLTDTFGCKSINLVNQRVRVAPRPNFALGNAIDNKICAGDTIHLSAAIGGSGNSNLFVTPNVQAFSIEGSRSDSLALPDGTGVAYKTSIYFTEFTPGQLLTNINDLEGICVNIEHSWMRDMEIKLTCPNGTQVILHNFGGQTGSEVFLGVPNESDEGGTPIPGQGFDYCWTPTATNGSWLQYANSVLGGNGTLPAGNYESAESLDALLGCPLNGEWAISVQDLWAIDNGFIFSWGVQFNEALYPNIESFSPALTDWNWNTHPSVYQQTPTDIDATPQNAGTAGYTFLVHDEFGCAWDTSVTVAVLPPTHPDCHKCTENFALLRDTMLCLGNSADLSAGFSGPLSQNIAFEAFPDYRFGNANHPHQNPYQSAVGVNSTGYNTLTDAATQIEKVCINIETDFDSDLNISLRSPDGKTLELSTGNGGSGDNYKTTCFSPSATTPIVGQTAPFNGSYKPEGAWSSLNGAQVNGDWKLMVSDGFGPTKWGKITGWSVSFVVPTTINYAWQNATSLSCNNCPEPTATPNATTNYVVLATDNFQCTHRDTVNVEVFDVYPSPNNLVVTSMENGSMTYTWGAVPGATGYLVNINNAGWVPANGNLSHKISGLANDDIVAIQVQATGGGPGCPPQIASAEQTYFGCLFTVVLGTAIDANCYGTATGSASMNANQGVSPINYYLDGASTFFNAGLIPNLYAGDHYVIAVDASGCRDTVNFTIGQPAAINVMTTVLDANCNGDDSGSATALATGNFPPFSYKWQKCTGSGIIVGATASNLYAGCYHVTVTDNSMSNCQIVDTVFIGEPTAFDFTNTATPVSCYNGSNGTATINVTGGNLPYTYKWANGSTTQTATGLPANFSAVTVTDDNGCEGSTLVYVSQPDPVNIDSVPSTGVQCFGGGNGTATVYAHGGTGAFTYKWETNATTQTVSGLMGGDIYGVTVTDLNGCTDVASVVVIQPPGLQMQITGIVNETCAAACDGKANITASGGSGGFNYAWSNWAGTGSAANGLCAGAFSVTVTDSHGCTNMKSANIQAAVPINVTLTPVNPDCFASNDGSINTVVTGGSGPYSYLWNNLSTSPNQSALACGGYVVTVTDNAGCTKISNVQLVCPPAVGVQSIVPVSVKCFGGATGTITVAAQGGTLPYAYSWSDPNNQLNPQAVNLLAGTYSVSITDANGCTTTASTTVTEPNQLLANITPTDVKCFGESTGTALANVMGGTGPFTYTWNVPQTTPVIAGLAAGTINLSVTDANGCQYNQASTQINQPGSAVSVTATQTQTGCFGAQSGEATAVAVGGNGAPFSFDWSNNLNGAFIGNLNPGNYGVTVTDQAGCTNANSVTVVEYTQISANIATTQPTCYGLNNGSATINSVSGGAGAGNPNAYTYNWSIPNPPNAIFISNLYGEQTYTVTITDNSGCSQVFETSLSQPPPIEMVIEKSDVTCFGLSDGSTKVTQVLGGHQAASFVWNTTQTGDALTGVGAGTYNVTVTDTEGCTGSSAITVTQPAELLITDFDITGLRCQGDSIGAAKAIVTGGTPVYRYAWETGDSTATLANLMAGSYLLTVTDLKGCSAVKSVEISQPTSILLNLEVYGVKCHGLKNGRAKVNVGGGTQPFKYSLDGTNFGNSSVFLGLSAGDYAFQVVDANGCGQTIFGSITEPEAIEASLGQDTTITLGDSYMLDPSIQNTVGNVTYNWYSTYKDSIHCLDSARCFRALVKPKLTNTYSLVVTDANGCTAKTSVEIKVDKLRGAYVPTGFSPNGDDENEKLCVFGKSKTIEQVLTFRVFDRWGELIYEDVNFEVNDTQRGWDGTFRGKEVESGQYAWFVEVRYLDGYRQSLQGSTMLIR